jgi:hypothetical protein
VAARLLIVLGLALAGALISLPTASAGDPWGELRRPLELPDVAAGERCPVSEIDESVDWESANIFGGSGIGPGPVYPGLGGTDPPGRFYVKRVGDGRWLGGKLFWYADPSYTDRALIRGRRLDGRGALRFDNRRSRSLRIRRNSEISWDGQPPGSRGRPSGVYARSTGCYGVQIDGTTFSITVVFRARRS